MPAMLKIRLTGTDDPADAARLGVSGAIMRTLLIRKVSIEALAESYV